MTSHLTGRRRPVIVRAVSSQEQRLRGYRIGLPQDTEALKPCPQTSRAMALHVHMKVKAREREKEGAEDGKLRWTMKRIKDRE
ncbi:uncharacterized protein LOC122522658 isoform X2 [Polistes fuscatus]|uniref:uncharacterized protein LOC122522658 isoform X2 n=1 Tax=Polistes fuscatus TaxID=30207 RepID=UPI001CA8212E|nr:uncharacterized protein LOC122522658 isoform X2 [Polistes fuscatus]